MFIFAYKYWQRKSGGRINEPNNFQLQKQFKTMRSKGSQQKLEIKRQEQESSRSKGKSEKKVDFEFILSSQIYKQKSCEICSKKHNQAKMILCDRCEDAFHIKCLQLSYIPEGTWICRQCHIDIKQIKQKQIMNKRPIEKNAIEECAGCRQRKTDFFDFEDVQGQTRVEARFVHLTVCIHCQQKYHSLCFSKRPNSINCQTCEQHIRECIPKGHSHYIRFLKESKNRIGNLNYLELSEGIQTEKPMQEYNTMQPIQLLSPTKPRDWRIITAYEASLCYALITRNMIYCQNLVLEMKAGRIETILKGHKVSVEKIYRLHRSDEQAYEEFKNRLELGFVPPIEIKEDRVKGFHMVSTDEIKANTIIAEYTGQLITARQSLNMISNESIFTLIRNPRSCQSLDIAPSQFANIAIFISGINNADTKGVEMENVRAVKFMYKGIARLILCTKRYIQPRQTLYLNYNGDRAVSEYPTSSFVP